MQISPVVGVVAKEFAEACWLLGEGNMGPGPGSDWPGRAKSEEEASRNPFEPKSSTERKQRLMITGKLGGNLAQV